MSKTLDEIVAEIDEIPESDRPAAAMVVMLTLVVEALNRIALAIESRPS